MFNRAEACILLLISEATRKHVFIIYIILLKRKYYNSKFGEFEFMTPTEVLLTAITLELGMY